VAITRSGTTTEIVRLLEQLAKRTPTTVLTTRADLPAARLADGVVLLDFADEQSVVQTRFATSVLLLLRAGLGEDVRQLPDQARTALAMPLPDPLPTHTVFLGTGWTIGLAAEAALKCREAAGAWTESYPVMEYQHGPIAVAGPSSLIWSFDPLPDFVRAAVAATGASVVEPALDPLAQLVAVHRLALALADAAGRDPDSPPHLSRSVQLD
jgi:fructoselysine-6-P-deglycase FrlB-like protein